MMFTFIMILLVALLIALANGAYKGYSKARYSKVYAEEKQFSFWINSFLCGCFWLYDYCYEKFDT